MQESGGQFSLENAARTWSTVWRILLALGLEVTTSVRSSPPVQIAFKHGRTSFAAGLISNPRFYERIMGWPTDWTAPERPATEFAAWLQLSRGRLSEMLTPETEAGRSDPA